MKDDILELIQTRQNVTFAELAQNIQGFTADDPAEACVLGSSKPGVILWCGLSRPAFDALRDLQTAGRIRARSCDPWAYRIDGLTLTLPLAKYGRRYRRPHWLPVSWSTTDR
jgi:hypothetical protein